MHRVIATALWCCGFWSPLAVVDREMINGGGNLQKVICVHNQASQPLPASSVAYKVGVVKTDQASKSQTLEDIHKAELSLQYTYGFSELTSISVQASYSYQHKESTTTSTMTSSTVSEELTLTVPEVDPNQTWCAYRLVSKAFPTGLSSYVNLMFSDIVVTSGELDITKKGDLIIDGTKQNWDDPSGYMFSTMKWGDGDSGWFMYMQNDGDGNCRGFQGDPGDQGHLLLHKIDGDKFLLSTKKWPKWYVYMQDQGDGNLRGWGETDPGPQGHWYFKPHPYKQCFLIGTEKWPGWYMYMQDAGDGNIRGWEGDPGDQGCWIIEKAWTHLASNVALLV